VNYRRLTLFSALIALAPAACGEGPSGHAGSGASGGGSSGGGSGVGGLASGGSATGGATGVGGSGVSGGAGGTTSGAGSGGATWVAPEPIDCEQWPESGDVVDLFVDGDDVESANENGLTFKGFGVLSANGTSALLMDYKAQHPEKYAELLQILFGGTRPIITHVKLEMGNDRNNSTGPDKATMRLADEDANVRRAVGFQLAADAKKLNSELKVSILRWNAPGWADSNDEVYAWFKATILAAYRTYGYMVDYVNPGLNEREPDLDWTKQYADRVRGDDAGFDDATERALYNAIKVVISDEVGVGSFGGEMVSDESLRDAVAVAGYHYNTDDNASGDFKKLAEEFDKEVWNSEAQATFSNSAFRPNNNVKDPSVAGTGLGGINGPLEMGNTIIKGFVKSRRSHFIYQPAIGAFYEGGQFSFKELLSARDPWSGWIHFDAGLLVLRHFSWFAKAGWENGDNTAGIWRIVPQSSATGATGTNPINGRNGTPSYMTLAAPDRSGFSTVLMNDSEQEKLYRIHATNLALAATPKLEVWETRAADGGEPFNANYLRYVCDLSANADGEHLVKVAPYSVVTVTTLANRESEEFNRRLPVEGVRTVLDTDSSGTLENTTDDILYADDFDYSSKTVATIEAGGELGEPQSFVDSRGGSASTVPRYFSDRNGAFEAFLAGPGNYVLRQQVDEAAMGLGGTWHAGNPITGIGDNRWLNYRASVDVSFESSATGTNNYAAIGARQQGGPNSHYVNGTPYVLKLWRDGGWQFLVDGTVSASGNVVSGSGATVAGFDTETGASHNIALEVSDNRVRAFVHDVEVTTFTDPNLRLSGRIDLASGYVFTRFDNLKVEKIEGQPPYYSELLDNLEMHDLAQPPAPKLEYSGPWAHANGKSMYNYQRSLSTSQGAGATLGYSFSGTGLDVLGPNDGSAKLEVRVDGEVKSTSASTTAASELYQTYSLRSLPAGQHTVELEVVSGTLVIDAIGVVP
jgi:hypothetical protein